MICRRRGCLVPIRNTAYGWGHTRRPPDATLPHYATP